MTKQMKKRKKMGTLPVTPVAIAVSVLLLAGVVTWIGVNHSISTAGSATLPSGANLSFTSDSWGYSVASNEESTKIKVRGYEVEFSKEAVTVDGVQLAKISDEMEQLNMTVNGDGLEVQADGREIAKLR